MANKAKKKDNKNLIIGICVAVVAVVKASATIGIETRVISAPRVVLAVLHDGVW